MEKYIEFIKDYKDCCKYLENIDNYDYEILSGWALNRYNNWIKKDNKYVFSVTVGNIPPKNVREKAINSLMNFKSTLEKIAVIEGIK